MLTISLIFVGIALVSNGMCRLCKVDAKSTSVINIITGVVIVVANFVMLGSATQMQDYINIASGFLFGFTYLFIAANLLFKLDLRPFGWFSLFVAIYAIVMAIVTFCGGGQSFWFYGTLWILWAVLWLEGFLEIVCKMKFLTKAFPFISIVEGVIAAFVPAIFIMLSVV